VTSADVVKALRAAGAEPRIHGGTVFLGNPAAVSDELKAAARAMRADVAAELEAEAGAIRTELAAWLERWERGCRWFTANPGRAGNALAYDRLVGVAAGWGGALEALEALTPGDPALSAAYERLDALALETDIWCGSEADGVAASITAG
jgi:hypothetical protein